MTDEPGVYLNPGARTALLEDYRDALSNHKFINRSELGMKECLQFIRKPDGSIEHSVAVNSQDPSGARSAHGDEVIADGLANRGMCDTLVIEDVSAAAEIPPGCLAWRQKQKQNAAALARQDRLGNGWES